MLPVIAQWPSFTLYSYGIFVAAAFFIGIFWAIRRGARAGLPGLPLFEAGIYGGAACIIGARLLYVLVEWPYYSRNPGEILRLWDGGLILYGGYAAALLFALFFLRLARLPLWKSLDAYAPVLALGLAIGRLGCFCNGCCYGLLSDHWGLRFPAAQRPPVFLQQLRDGLIRPGAAETLPVLPTQLYSAAGDLGILFGLLWLERKPRFPGFLFWTFVLLYALFRAGVEFFRYHESQEMTPFALFSLSQVISFGLVAVSALMLSTLRSRSQGGII